MVTGSVEALAHLGRHGFRIEHSVGLAGRAAEIADIVEAGLDVLSPVLGFSPSLTLRVLSRNDWPQYTKNPVYGMPHAPGRDVIVVAADPPEFWDGIRAWAFRPVPDDEMRGLEATYGVGPGGEIDVRPFNDLMVLHELGHIFHRQVPFEFPRIWLGELFANLCHYVAVAEGLPLRLNHLNALPRAVHRSSADVSHVSLSDFDALQYGVGMGNFVWYEWQLLAASRAIYNAEGPPALRRLFEAGLQACDRQMTDAELASCLDRKAGARFAAVMRNWPRVA